jgi:hypothetical protein
MRERAFDSSYAKVVSGRQNLITWVAALCPPADPLRAYSHGTSRHAIESTQALVTLPHGGCPSRLPVKAPLPAPLSRSVPPLGRVGLDGSLPLMRSGGSRAWWSSPRQQEAHTADLCAGRHAG